MCNLKCRFCGYGICCQCIYVWRCYRSRSGYYGSGAGCCGRGVMDGGFFDQFDFRNDYDTGQFYSKLSYCKKDTGSFPCEIELWLAIHQKERRKIDEQRNRKTICIYEI